MNPEIAKILFNIAEYLAMDEVPFKPRAYEKAAQRIVDLEEDVRDIYAREGLKSLKQIPGVGEAIALKIEEYIKAGKVEYYEKLKKTAPVDLSELGTVEGLGPKSIKRLYNELGIKSLKDLEAAAKKGKIRELRGFGVKAEEKILKNIGFAQTTGVRSILGLVMPRISSIEERLRKLPHIERIIVAGSARRQKETIGDVDLLAISSDPAPVMEYFVNMPEVVNVIAHGETKSSVKIRGGLNVDLRVVPSESYGAALNYFTGSKSHNVALRQLAIKHGYKLNEYGLFKGERQIAGRTEEEIYEKLGLTYIPPELRENTGEIELARAGKLPKLIEQGDLMGDLQVQTDWSDGKESIEAMARAAAARGLKYMLVTDHTKRLAMTNGLDEKRILKQMAEIDRVNKTLKGKIVVLKGSECDILKDGSMDLPDHILAKLDVVGGSIHSYFNVPRAEQTARIKRAMENPHVDIIFHPTGRIINRRSPYDIDLEELIRTALRTGTVLEVDAYPDRSDLCDEYIRRCVAAGVRLAIDSDAHASSHFSFLEYGISQARRGWAEKKDVVNTWPLDKMLSSLKDGSSRPAARKGGSGER
jgi:DNA polymerase (family X)